MKAGVRLDHNTGQYFPTLDGKDISPSSFDEARALEIAEQAVKDAPLIVLHPMPRLLDNYATEDGWRMERENYGKTPDGRPINGRWVLRDQLGNFVDHDSYRYDLAERNHMRIAHDDEDRLNDQSIIEGLTKALQDIINECPNPKKLPYAIRVNEIAREAIERAKKTV